VRPYHLGANPGLAHTTLDACYSPHERTAATHLSVLADLYTAAAAAALATSAATAPAHSLSPAAAAAAVAAAAAAAGSPDGLAHGAGEPLPPSCPPTQLIVLVLYKLVHPSAAVRDDAVALLKAVAVGPATCCPPRHPMRCEPSCLELIGIT
jgi:hypothetical protein